MFKKTRITHGGIPEVNPKLGRYKDKYMHNTTIHHKMLQNIP